MRPALLLAALMLLPIGLAAALPVPVGLPVQGPALGYQLACPMKGPQERCNTRLSIATGPANENMVAANPRNPLEFLAVAKDYDHASPGQSSCVGSSFYHTVDGGATWREGYVANVGPPCESDPVANFDTDGVAWVNTLRISPRQCVNYRPDGAAWQQVSTIPCFDKQWIGTNPATGTLYMIDALSRFMRSTDGGLTWSTGATGIGGFAKMVAAAPSGRVVVTGLSGSTMIAWVSTNDGLSFTGPHAISSVSFSSSGTLALLNQRQFRIPATHGLAVDPVGGRFWVAFPGQVPGQPGLPAVGSQLASWDIWLSHSDDGLAWSTPVRLTDDVGGFQVFPTVAVTADGVAHVAWMDQRLDPTGVLVDVYYANTAGPLPLNVRLTDQPWNSMDSYHQDGFVFVGDYIGIAASDDRVVVTFPDTRNGRAELHAAVLTKA